MGSTSANTGFHPAAETAELLRQKYRRAEARVRTIRSQYLSVRVFHQSGVSAGRNCCSVSAETFGQPAIKLADERSVTGVPAICVDLSSITANCLPRGKGGSHNRYSQRTKDFQGGQGLAATESTRQLGETLRQLTDTRSAVSRELAETRGEFAERPGGRKSVSRRPSESECCARRRDHRLSGS
jgi:hypothetical protein